VELTPVGDTYLKSGSPNQNQGGEAILRVRQSGKNRVLLKFDEAAIEAAVGSEPVYEARIDLTISQNGGQWGSAGRSVGIHRMTAPFAELGATWNCAEDSNTSNSAEDCPAAFWEMEDSTQWPFWFSPTSTRLATNDTSGVFSFDVTEDVRAFVSGSEANFGWLVRLINENESGQFDFASRETGTPPKLVVTFGTPEEDAGVPEPCRVTPIEADTFVRQGSPNQNEGGLGLLRIQSDGKNRALVKVDAQSLLDAAGGQSIESAELSFTIGLNGGNWGEGRELDLHRMLVPWEELAATWNCALDANLGNAQPDCEAEDLWNMDASGGAEPYDPVPLATVLVTNEMTETLTLDITEDVQAIVAGAPFHGWILRKRDEGQAGLLELVSREASATSSGVIITCASGGGGEADGGVTHPEDCRNGIDDDQDGAMDCADVDCQVSGPDATCDGIDEDCDGAIDEDFATVPTSCGIGACASTGLWSCLGGAVVDTCTVGVPAADDVTCDGVDNDCDGEVDEDCCIPASCQDYNIDCGTVDDGCGSTIDCGICTGEEICGGGGTPNVCGIPLPPDPATIAPPGPTGSGSFLQSFAFLTEGTTPVQTGVEPGALEPHRAGLLRGRVLSHSGQPIPAVQVSVLGDPSLGSTLSRADGAYDLLVNGGGQVTLRFEAVGHLPVQRTVEVPWSNALEVDDVVLTVPGPAATVNGQAQKVTFGASAPTQVARGQAYSNDDGIGSHRVVGFLPAGLEAVAEVNGQTLPVVDGTLRVTEYTVGEAGPLAMPAKLPENSLYTFAVDLTLAELGPHAKVTFNKTTYFYVDDFLDSPLGAFVPNGYYDYDLGRWVPSTDGLVMKVIGVTPEGLAQLDALADGQETETDPVELQSRLGLGAEERAVLAQLYGDGRKFWRMPIDHLTPWDWNQAGVRLEPPPPEPARDEHIAMGCQPPPPYEEQPGSILNCPGRDLAEEISIAGTDFSLRYDSHRAKANVAQGRTAVIQFPPQAQAPAEAIALVVKARVLGRTLVDLELPLPLPAPYDQDPSYTVTWDGLDAYGRPWAGLADLEYSVSYRFNPRYQAFLARSLTILEAQESFGGSVCNRQTDPCCAGGNRAVGTFPGRSGTQSSLGFRRRIPLGASGVGQYGFGGWSLSAYHYYDARKRALLRGDGYIVNEGGITAFGVVAGLESDGNSSNDLSGGSALKDITSPRHMAVAPDGTVYFNEDNPVGASIRRISRAGDLDAVTWSGASCSVIRDLAVDGEGRLYVACQNPIQRIVRLTKSAAGPWNSELLFGANVTAPVWKDGQPLAGRRISPLAIAFRDDGTMLFTAIQRDGLDQTLVYSDPPSSRQTELIEVLPDGRGRIVQIPAGTDSQGQRLEYEMGRIAAGPDNSVVSFVRDPNQSDSSPGHLIQLLADDSVSVWAEPRRPDGSAKAVPGFDWESLQDFHPTRAFRDFRDITVSRDGDVFLTLDGECFQRAQQLYQFSRDGLVRRVKIVGVVEPSISLTGCPADLRARSAMEAIPWNVAAGPDGRVFVSDRYLHRIYALGGSEQSGQSFEIASRDGTEIYAFSLSGLHLSTRDAQTGDEFYRFDHDANGRLESITDRDGRITEIRRVDGATIEIAAPGGPGASPVKNVTTLRLSPEDELEEVQDSRGARWSFDYDSPDASLAGQGLLQRMWDPRANDNGLRSGDPTVFAYEPFRVNSGATPKPGAPWLLKRDTDRAGGSQAMSIAVSRAPLREITAKWCDGSTYVRAYANNSTTSTVTRTTLLGRETTYSTTLRNQFAFDLYRTGARPSDVSTTTTRPDGWHITRYDPNDHKQGALRWEGGRLDYALMSHARLGDTVLVPKTSTLSYFAKGSPGTEDYRREIRQDASSTWTSDFDVAPGFSTPTLERVETTVTPFDASSGPPRLSIAEYVSTPERKATSTSPEGRTSAYVLDDRSRIVRLEPPGQVPIVYLYDANGFVDRVIRVKGTKTRVTTFGYDPRGYVSSVRNKVSDTVTDEVTMVNDPAGFATEATVPGLLTVGSTPDITGALSALTPDGKPTHQLSYTPLGQLSEYASPAGTLSSGGSCASGTQCWRYSLDRELEDITLPDGTVVDYVYDPVKATLSSVNVPGHGVTAFGYDGVGRRTSATAPPGGTMTFAWQSTLPIRTTWSGAHTVPGVPGTVSVNGTVERFYNDFLEVSELHVTGGAKVKLLRDRDGLVTSLADVGGVFPTLSLARSPIDGHVTGTTLDTVTTSHVLDVSQTTPGFGDLLSVAARAGTTDLYDAAYTYDDRGRIDTWTETVENDATRTRKFGYDAAGRLVSVHDITGGLPGTLLEEYAYDGNGNREKAFSSYLGAVPLDTEFPSSIRCTGPSGDTAANHQDQLCEYGGFTYSYNARGQLQSKSDGMATTSYSYDGLGRLLGVTEPGMDLHYVLDALGRRIGKIRDGNLEKGWLYADALNPIAELDGAGHVRATFIYGTRAHVPDAMVLTDGTVYRLITDHLGSVRLVVNAATGEVVQRMDYDAFGRVLSDTSPGFQPFGFAGGLYDDDTGLVRFGARDYDAYSGRWTAKDPLLFGSSSTNLYAYVDGDPVNRIDPSGLDWRSKACDFLRRNQGDTLNAWIDANSEREWGDDSQDLADAEHYLYARWAVETNPYQWGVFYVTAPGYAVAKALTPRRWWGGRTSDSTWEQVVAGITGANDGLFGSSLDCDSVCGN
jgi:RHS repeat-associated protein